jgi:Predicted transcriptional regulators
MAVHKKFALGRGLDALISMDEVKTEGSSSINEIELSKISVNPSQPRREFDQTALEELADSIKEIGIIQPITLRKYRMILIRLLLVSVVIELLS